MKSLTTDYVIPWAINITMAIVVFIIGRMVVGFVVRLVNKLNLMPLINTGIAHTDPGIGQIGAGILRAPRSCFEEALEDFSKLF